MANIPKILNNNEFNHKKMKPHHRFLQVLCVLILLSSNVFAQKIFTVNDYKKADSLVDLFGRNMFHTVQKVNWVDGRPVFWYSTLTANGKQFWYVNAETLKKEKIFDVFFFCFPFRRTDFNRDCNSSIFFRNFSSDACV